MRGMREQVRRELTDEPRAEHDRHREDHVLDRHRRIVHWEADRVRSGPGCTATAISQRLAATC